MKSAMNSHENHPNKNPTKIPDFHHHKQSHGKSTIFIIGTPIKNGDFPWDF